MSPRGKTVAKAIMSIEAAAFYLGIKPELLRYMTVQKKIKYVRKNGSIYFYRKADLDELPLCVPW